MGEQATWAAVYLGAGVLGGVTRLPSPPVAFVWPAAGVAVLWFLLTPPALRLRVAMPLLAVMAFSVNVVTSAPVSTSVAFALANVAHAIVGGEAFRRVSRHTPDSLRDARGLLGVGVGSVLGAVAGTPVILALLGPADLEGALAIVVLWVPRFTASTAVVMAFVLAWRAEWADRAAGRGPGRPARRDVALVLAVALTVHAVVYAARPDDAFAFLTLPVTVLVGWRLGPAWTATYGLVAGALGVLATLAGNGPFAAVEPATLRTVLVQGFIAVTGLVGLALSLEVVQRRRALVASDRRGEELERTLETAVVPNALVSLEEHDRGTVRSVNPALQRWWGTDDEHPLVGSSWLTVLDASDRPAFSATLDGLARGDLPSWEGQLVHRTRSGERRVCLTVAGVLRHAGRDDEPAERVANVQLVDVTQRTLLEEQLAHQALHDQLTGLPNRTLLHERIEHALGAAARSGQAVALLFLDMDHFKRVNDTLGHGAGDLVLAEVASRLMAAVRPGDTVARIGGDEFVVCCPDVEDESVGEELARRILRHVCDPLTVHGRTVPVSASIGMTLARPGAVVGDLLREADTAMYEAKLGGRGRTAVFASRPAEEVAPDPELAAELTRAIDEHQLVLHFQPMVEIESGRVTALEALVRWEHPRRGLLLPDRWLDVAEASGLMPRLGDRVLRDAFRQWPRAVRAYGTGVRLSVDVSASQLTHGGFAQAVAAALADTRMPAERAVLELTEAHLLSVHEPRVLELDRVRSLGVRVAVDGFGAGSSSLAQLTVLPIDEVKIDREVVAAMGADRRSRAVVDGVVAASRALSLDVVAQGVETHDIARRVAASGCRTGQGPLWGGPAPLA